MTVVTGIITALTVTPGATDGYSKVMHDNFRSAAPTQLIGQPVANLHVHAIGGASLTTEAFQKFVAAAETKQVSSGQ